MSIRETIESIYSFAGSNTGTVGRAMERIDKGRAISPVFFTPYRSTASFFHRAADVVIAPVLLSVLVLGQLIESVFYLVKSLFDLFTLNFVEAGKDLESFVVNLMSAVLFAAVEAFSPLVNFVDFVGGGVASLLSRDEEPQTSMSPSLN